MTVQEMHIGLDVELQKIASNSIDAFLPEHKDWALNEEVIRYVKSKLNPESDDKKRKFQETQKRFDDIRPLITPLSLSTYRYNDDAVFSFLPSNYFSLVNDRSLTTDLCGKTFTLQTTVETKHITAIRVVDDADLYDIFTLTINGVVVYTWNNALHEITDTSAKFVVINNLIEILNELGYQCKYDKLNEIEKSGYILIETSVSATMIVNYTGLTETFTSTSHIYNKVTNIKPTVESPNRLTNTEILFDVLPSSFAGTMASSPISTLEQNRLIVYHKKKFICANLNISYIRKPRKIDIFLNRNCDLDENVHSEIVSNTAKYLASLTQGQLQGIINENLLKE